ncbi:MAG: MFS transporter, partial [Eubacterium sp.]
MKITGIKRWIVLTLVALLGGIMVYVPYLRFNYYDQMLIIFTQFKPIVSASHAHEFIGDIGLWFGIFSVLIYPLGGILADKFSERNLLVIGALLMGLTSFWYGLVPSSIEIMIIHILYGIGTSIFIWSAYLKIIRKMGTENEQGRMYSSSEFIRAIVGTLIGFLGASLLNKAIFPGTGISPEVLGQQWKMMLFFDGALFLLLGLFVFIFVPKNITGLEETSNVVQEPFSMKNILTVLKMPGTWLLAFLIFFCYSFTAAGAGYLGTYTTKILGLSETQASNFAVIRNYILAGLSTLAIGFIADKMGSKIKTLGIYLGLATIMTIVMLITKNIIAVCIAVTFIFATVYTGMRGIYFATLSEVGIPLSLTGVATGI